MINYVILACDQIELDALLKNLQWNKVNFEDIVIVIDSDKTSIEVKRIIEKYSIKSFEHPLNGDFSQQRNFANSKCVQPYIFHLDSDEIPNKILIDNLPTILNQNPNVDIFGVPRLNYLENDTDLTEIPLWVSPPEDSLGRINWPDYQFRIIKNSERIKWVNKVHEVPTGSSNIATLPAIPSLCIIHNKTVSGQMQRQKLYQKIQNA